MKIKKFDKFKKRKTRISKVSDNTYTWNPLYNPGSPSPGTSTPMVKIKID